MMKELLSFKFLGALLISLLFLFNVNLLIGTVVSLFYTMIFLTYNLKKTPIAFTILELLIYTLPFSFIPIIPQVKFISLFIVLQILMTILLLTKNRSKGGFVSRIVLLIIILSNIIYILAIGVQEYLGYESIIKLNIFLISILVVSKTFKLSHIQVDLLEKKFVMAGLISAITISLQYFFNTYYNIKDLGIQSKMGELRQGFSGLFFDYSIMSIFLSGFAALIIINMFNKKTVFNKYIDVLLILFFVLTSVLTSARSGLSALLITVFIYLIWKRSFKTLLIGTTLTIPSIILILQFLAKSRGTEITSGSGRGMNLMNSLAYFLENPFFGSAGIGYNLVTGEMLPHNFIIDFLVDFGFFITVFLLVLLFYILRQGLRIKPKIAFLFLLYLAGGMFHASFVNTHYIIVPVFLILSLKNQYK